LVEGKVEAYGNVIE